MPFAVDIDSKWRYFEVGLTHGAIHVFGAELFGLLFHVLDQVGTVDATRKSGKIFDRSGEGKLAPRLMADDDKGFQVSSGTVDGGGVPGAAGAQNDDVSHYFIVTTESTRSRLRNHAIASNAVPIRTTEEGSGTVLLCGSIIS